MDTPFPKNKIKILYVITQDEWGGAQRYVFDLATLYGTDDEVVVVAGTPKVEFGLEQHILIGKDGRSEKLQNVKFVRLKHLVRPISWQDFIFAPAELAKLIKIEKPDIVHLNSSKASVIGSWAIKKIAKDSRPKVVYTVHGWVFNEPMGWLKRALYKWIEKSTSKYKDAIIVLSETDKDSGIKIGLNDKKLHLISHGLQPIVLKERGEARKIIKEDPCVPENTKPTWFVVIANAYKTKGIDKLLQAIATKKDVLSSVNFFIMGVGPELNNLDKLANSLSLNNNIFFMGFFPFASSFLKAFDVLVLPSLKEGLPYVIQEALLAKVPIIATRVGGIPSLIENKKSGLLVKPDSVEELAEALVFAAENPDTMKQYANNATPPPPLSEMVNKTTWLYRSLCSLP